VKDDQYQKLLDAVIRSKNQYLTLLDMAQKEYKERAGDYPGNLDDDQWIDTFEACGLSEYVDFRDFPKKREKGV